MAETRLPHGQGLHKTGPDVPVDNLKRLQKVSNRIGELGHDSRILADLLDTKVYASPGAPDLSEQLLFATRFLTRIYNALEAMEAEINAIVLSEVCTREGGCHD